MKIYEEPQHEIIRNIVLLEKTIEEFKSMLQKSDGIDYLNPYFPGTKAMFHGTFTKADNSKSTLVKITAAVVGATSNATIIGDGSTVAALVAALVPNYVIEGDGTQVLKTGEAIVILGGSDSDSLRRAKNLEGLRYATLIDSVAGDIKTFYDGLDLPV